MSKIPKETATGEVTTWLDHKKVSENKRELQKDTIDTLVDAICDGLLVVREDKILELTLKFPLDGEIPKKTLEFKPRINAGTVQKHLQGVKASDIDGRLTAYICALTGEPKSVIGKLDTEDVGIANAIAVFFL